jgi:polygalacturonase
MLMMKIIGRISLLILTPITICFGVAVKPKVVVYPAPAGETLSKAYHVLVQGLSVPVYVAKVAPGDKVKRFKGVDDTRHSADYFETAAFAYFDMQGAAKVAISVPENVTSVKILPASAAIKTTIASHSVIFTITKPQNLTIEINGEVVQSLHLFANPLEKNIPNPNNPDVIFYGPGIHQVSHLLIGSNKIVYIAGGAIVQAIIDPSEKFTVNARDSLKNYDSPTFELTGKNITFRGRGILDASLCPTHARNLLLVRKGLNIKIEGVILRDASTWNMPIRQSDSVVVDNVKILGYRANSDGIDICNSRDVLVKNCFIRTDDDLIVVKADKGQGQSKNITVKHNVLWNPVAHALSIGAELREPVNNVLFTDCDIIHDHGREWSMRIYQCDSALISNIRFENIRVEEAHRLISLWIGKAIWSRDKDFGHIENVSFNNINATGSPLNVELQGADAQHGIQKVSFNNVLSNGKPISLQDVKANGFVKDVRVEP